MTAPALLSASDSPIPPARLWWATTRRWLARPNRLLRLRAEISLTQDIQRLHAFHILATAAETGLLRILASGPATPGHLVRVLNLDDTELLKRFLKLAASHRVVRRKRNGEWVLRGHRARALAKAGEEGLRGRIEEVHRLDTAAWSGMADHLRGRSPGPYLDSASLAVARGSRSVDDAVLPLLSLLMNGGKPTRILDVGCGDARYLLELLSLVPEANGVGVEYDPGVSALARERALACHAGDRARILDAMADPVLAEAEFDFVLAVQILYYIPPGKRLDFMRWLAANLSPGGRLLLVWLAAGDSPVSVHYDLLFRVTRGLEPPPSIESVTTDIESAGLRVLRCLPLMPGQPLMAMVAQR